MPDIKIIQSQSRPKIITFIASDNQPYKYLIKKNKNKNQDIEISNLISFFCQNVKKNLHFNKFDFEKT